jgi:hypothetical protein
MTKEELAIRLGLVEELLNVWLTDNTQYSFEEEPHIDDARGLLIDIIDELNHEQTTAPT